MVFLKKSNQKHVIYSRETHPRTEMKHWRIYLMNALNTFGVIM